MRYHLIDDPRYQLFRQKKIPKRLFRLASNCGPSLGYPPLLLLSVVMGLSDILPLFYNICHSRFILSQILLCLT
uniref:Uncharacterized protein n=1 Tax=Arundo donax TaxID=35708 RepID=A0A0A9E8S8_ARUDO